MLKLYENIKKRRTELNISQQELAELVGYIGGWSRAGNAPVMKSVYQNNIKSMSDYYADRMNDHIDGIMQKKGEAK